MNRQPLPDKKHCLCQKVFENLILSGVRLRQKTGGTRLPVFRFNPLTCSFTPGSGHEQDRAFHNLDRNVGSRFFRCCSKVFQLPL
jgi:hypothetical protein